jgi:hypothetical protein
VILAAEKLGIVRTDSPREPLKQLKDFWSKNKVEGRSFVSFETALLRIGKDYRRKGILDGAKDERLLREAP